MEVDLMEKAAAVASSTISDDLYTVIRLDIISGRFSPGEKLRIEAMRELYSAGNSPLREALTKLASTGLLVQENQRGFKIPMVSREDLQDICHSRIHIEVCALKLSIQQGDDLWEGQVVAAYHCLQKAQLTRKQETEEWERRHSEFHYSLIDACQSPSLLKFCHILHDQFDRYRRLAPSNTALRSDLDQQHQEIMHLALARDVEAAGVLLTRHIQLSAASALALFD